jgi:hypothetical protein
VWPAILDGSGTKFSFQWLYTGRPGFSPIPGFSVLEGAVTVVTKYMPSIGSAGRTKPLRKRATMIIQAAIAVAAIAGVIVVMGLRRARHYRRLGTDLAKATLAPGNGVSHLPPHQPPSFAASIATLPNFMAEAQFAGLVREVEALAGAERSYVPTHKKGGTIAYETLIERAPSVAELYHSEALRSLVSRTVGVKVDPTPLHDQSSLSILVYDRPGDHIGWHYDHNFYRGRHFTLLLPVVNIGHAASGLSHARLSAKTDGVEREIEMPPNTLVLFEGAKVLHKVSPIVEGERRVVISMTYCADSRSSGVQAVARRLKDTAFFGVRALWS